MSWTSLDTWIVITGVLSALACAIPGSFLVLKKMSMMGDAISHAVLPGLALAFLFTHSRDSLSMFIGAAAVGVLTAVFIDWVNRLGRVEESASMGVVFTTLFALGLVLIVRGADHVDLDPSCVLYGAVELVPLDTVSWGSWEIPRAVAKLAVTLLFNIAFVWLFYKELLISTFDPALSDTQGIPSKWMNFFLMAIVAITAVAAFESVGSILVIAMMIVPAATAQLTTDRLSSMLWVSGLVAVASAGLGHLAAITLPPLVGFEDTNTAGMMAVVAGLFFTVAVLFAPRKGILSRFRYQLELGLRVLQEDLLGMLYRLEESPGDNPELHSDKTIEEALLINSLQRWLTTSTLRRKGLIRPSERGWLLTEEGRERARKLVRTHRLWEVYLHTHLDTPHVHSTAHRLEHTIDEKQLRQMDQELDYPDLDPHGTPIPRE
ncbi:MAG: metal ABC transporter permease [Vulcanimicrobiota bacterium]